MELVIYDDLAFLPLFNPDLDTDDLPSVVRDLRREIGACQGLIFAVPEYAHGLPGAFENMLDWLVSSTVFPGKPIAILNTAPRAHHAQGQLREVIGTMAGRIIEDASISVSMRAPMPASAALTADPKLALQIRDALSAFAVAIESPAGHPCG